MYHKDDAFIVGYVNEQRESVGNEDKNTNPALTPTLAFPFAAPSVSGSVADAGPQAENQTRLLLWSVERTIAGLSNLAQQAVDTRCHIVLPGSPNRGMNDVATGINCLLRKVGQTSNRALNRPQ